MTQMITIVIALISCVLSFAFHPLWAWIPIAFIDLALIVLLYTAKLKYKFIYTSDLSPTANELLKRYSHYFFLPFASKDFSASAATSQFACVLIAVIGVFKGFWWGIGFAVLNWFVMGFVSIHLSPTSLLANSTDLQIAHDEIFEYIHSMRKGTHNQ